MALTPEQIEAKLKTLEAKSTRLERLLHSGRGLTDITQSLATDLVDLGEVPIAKMHQTGAQTLSNNTWTTITMGALDFDFIGAGVDLAAEEITIRRGGLYLLNGRVTFAANSSGTRFVAFSVNSAADPNEKYGGTTGDATFTTSVGGTSLVSLDVGDTVELMGWQGSGGDLATDVDATRRSYLAVILLANN